MPSNGLGSTARQRSRPPRREFVTTIGTEELGRYAGVGLSLEEVIREELRHTGNTSADDGDDVVIWEGNRALALIRAGPAGEPNVTRFDQIGSESTVPSVPQGGTGSPKSSSSWDEVAFEETCSAIAHLRALRQRLERDKELSAADAHDAGNGSHCDTERAPRDSWTRLLRLAEASAQRHLLFCLLFINGKLADPNDLTTLPRDWPPCGVIRDDRLYLAFCGRREATPEVVEVTDLVRLDQRPD